MSARGNMFLKTGRLVEAIMRYRGMSIGDLAKLIGWSTANTYKLLNGGLVISDDVAIRLSSALNCSPALIMASKIIDLTHKDNGKEQAKI